jgi:hypothetical protein
MVQRGEQQEGQNAGFDGLLFHGGWVLHIPINKTTHKFEQEQTQATEKRH